MNKQKTYKGRTAYSYVRTARVRTTITDDNYVFADNEMDTLRVVDGDTIELRNAGGLIVLLQASDKALKRLDKLESECG